jgi:hypothetical protein
MKLSVLMVFCIFLLTGCLSYHPIHKSEDNGLQKVSLIQTPETNFLNEKEVLTSRKGFKTSTSYLFEEKVNVRPMVTVKFNIDRPQNAMHDSTVFIFLDSENIQLFAVEGRYVIPENLWVPIVHSHTVQYLLYTNHDQLVFKLNDKQKDQLTAFFNKAIQQRDHVFPALPPGMKKW